MFICETCTYPASNTTHCDNPGCMSNPSANHKALREQAEQYAARKAEDDARLAFRAHLRQSGFTSL